MAKSCKEGGTVHGAEIQTGTYEIELGPEMVMYGEIKCQDCGTSLRNIIISRRKKPNS